MVKLIRFLLPFFLTGIVICALVFSGLRGHTAQFAQAGLLKTGLLNASVEQPEQQEEFPFDFALQTLDEQVVNLKELRGKVIFLNIWATWCGPCRAEMPGIESLFQTAANDSVVFIMLAIDKTGDEEKIARYVQEKAFTFPVYRPLRNFAGNLPNALRVPSIPTTFVIDKDGMIAYKKVGTANYNTKRFKDFLTKLSSQN